MYLHHSLQNICNLLYHLALQLRSVEPQFQFFSPARWNMKLKQSALTIKWTSLPHRPNPPTNAIASNSIGSEAIVVVRFRGDDWNYCEQTQSTKKLHCEIYFEDSDKNFAKNRSSPLTVFKQLKEIFSRRFYKSKTILSALILVLSYMRHFRSYSTENNKKMHAIMVDCYIWEFTTFWVIEMNSLEFLCYST